MHVQQGNQFKLTAEEKQEEGWEMAKKRGRDEDKEDETKGQETADGEYSEKEEVRG